MYAVSLLINRRRDVRQAPFCQFLKSGLHISGPNLKAFLGKSASFLVPTVLEVTSVDAGVSALLA